MSSVTIEDKVNQNQIGRNKGVPKRLRVACLVNPLLLTIAGENDVKTPIDTLGVNAGNSRAIRN